MAIIRTTRNSEMGAWGTVASNTLSENTPENPRIPHYLEHCTNRLGLPDPKPGVSAFSSVN